MFSGTGSGPGAAIALSTDSRYPFGGDDHLFSGFDCVDLLVLFLILFGEIIYKKKKKVTSFSANSAVEGSKMSVDGVISASDADITSDGGAVHEVGDAITRHGDSMTSRYVAYYIHHIR
jgi:hypothetical protein